MKLKPEQIMYVRSMGKALRITSMFYGSTRDKQANEHMEKHKDEGVIAEFGDVVLLANLYDRGVKIDD